MNQEDILQQTPDRTQSTKEIPPERMQPTKVVAQPRKRSLIGSLIKLIIIIAFFVGAYYLLNKLGIIDKIKEGYLLFTGI